MSSVPKNNKIPSAAERSKICHESTIDKLRLQKENGVCHMPVCRVCLATNVKLFHILEHQLSVLYGQVTGFEINSEDRLPQMLCWECVGRLTSANRFIEKAHKSQWIISKKIKCGILITLDDIELIDKAQHKLHSSLNAKFHEVNDCYLHIDKQKFEMHNTINCNNETNNNKELYIDKDKAEMKNTNYCNNDISNNRELYIDNKEKAEMKNTNYCNNDISKNRELYIDKEKSEKLNINNCNNETSSNKEFVEPGKIYNEIIMSNIIDISFDEDTIKTEEYDVDEVTENNFVFTYKHSETDTDNEYVSDIKKEHETESEDEVLQKVLHMANESIAQMEYNAQNYLMKISGTDSPRDKQTEHPTSASSSKVTDKRAKPEGPFICHHCNKSFIYKTGIKAHMQTHLKGLSCPYCDHTFRFKYNLSTHINSKHTKKIAYPCSYCDFKSFCQMSLRTHEKLKHVRTYMDCPHCDHRTHSRRNLKVHINAVHTKSIVFDCTYCDYRTTRKQHLDGHVNAMHTKSVSYDCTQCSFKSYYRRCLNSHVRKMHTSCSSNYKT